MNVRDIRPKYTSITLQGQSLRLHYNLNSFAELEELYGSVDTAMEAIKLGAYDYLTKPCEIEELVTKIEGAWEKKEDAEERDMREKIQRVVESPLSVFDLLPPDKDKRK